MSDPVAPTVARTMKRNDAILVTLIRLKHRLDANEEIEDAREEAKQLLQAGVVPQLESVLADLQGHS